MRGLLCAVAVLAAAFLVPAVAQAAAPANDAFAAAEVIAGPSGTVFGTRAEATVEPGEPRPMPQFHSIWYAWKAPAYGTLSFDTAGTAWAWVFTGDTLDALSMKINGQRYGFVSVKPGETYRFGLDDWNENGPTQLTWSFAETPAPPPNDDFANAATLEGTGGTVDVDTSGATKETCEPQVGSGHSVWYAYTPPSDGELTVQGTIVTVNSGKSVCGLTEDAYSGGDPAVANVIGGTTYWIGFDSWPDAGPRSFTWSFATPARPVNDDFANATPLDPVRGSVFGNALHATSEPGEPTPFFGHTVWYVWRPSSDGVARVDFMSGDGVVYTGDSLDALQTVAFDGGTFDVTAGVAYRIQVASGGTYQVDYLLEPNIAPANDAFATPAALSGTSGYVEGTNRLATVETGEPDDGGTSRASVWYAWKAPADGPATFWVDSSFWTIHQIYTGTKLTALTLVDGAHDVDAQRYSFNAVAGMTYRVVVDGRAGGSGRFWLGWQLDSAPPAAGTRPVAQSDALATDEDTPVVVSPDMLLANDSDADGDAISFVSVSVAKAGHGTVTSGKGGITFTPDPDFNGEARFLYTIVDSTGLESTGDVLVDVAPVNDAPTVVLKPTAASEGAPSVLVALANDVDGDPLTFDWTTSVGTIEPDGPTAALTVDDGPSVATIQVTATDGVESAVATADVTVENMAPTIAPDPFSGMWGLPVALTPAVTDPSAVDTAAGFVTGPASALYAAPGAYTATYTATDKDGATGSTDLAVSIGRRPSTLAYVGSTNAPFGFAVLQVVLGDRADAATAKLTGHAVSMLAGSLRRTLKTTKTGAASAAVGGALLPGVYTVKASFAGDGLYGASSAGARLTVVNSAGKANADATLADGTHVVFDAQSDGNVARGTLTAGAFAATVSALGIDGTTAWLAGAAADGTPFVASVTDAGEPGAGRDVVAVWIGGTELAGNGVIVDGNVQLHK